ncbi:MAG: hypothetical protein WBM37_02720 [Nitrososphaeraceae archaeon]
MITSFIRYNLNIPSMAFIYCKKCGEYRYLTPHAFRNIADFGAKCEKCETVNTITQENGELKKQV